MTIDALLEFPNRIQENVEISQRKMQCRPIKKIPRQVPQEILWTQM